MGDEAWLERGNWESLNSIDRNQKDSRSFIIENTILEENCVKFQLGVQEFCWEKAQW